MKRSIVAALAILAFGTLVTTAHAQTLVTPPAWLNTSVGAITDRDLAYNPATGNLLLTRTSPAILRLKSSDGTSAGADMDLTGVSGGTYTVSGIAVLDDGTIFVCNYVTGSQSAIPLKIYQWNNETGQATMVASVTGEFIKAIHAEAATCAPLFKTDTYGDSCHGFLMEACGTDAQAKTERKRAIDDTIAFFNAHK